MSCEDWCIASQTLTSRELGNLPRRQDNASHVAGKETCSPKDVCLVTEHAKSLMKAVEETVHTEAMAREKWAKGIKEQLCINIREEMQEDVCQGCKRLTGTRATVTQTALKGFVAPQEATNMMEENASQEPDGWVEYNNDLDLLEMLNGSGDRLESMQDDNEEGGTQPSIEHGGASAASSSSPEDALDTGAGTCA
jgi:hypothetical protein